MPCRAKKVFTATSLLQLLAFPVLGPAAPASSALAESLRGDKSPPRLSVRVYSFAGLSPWLLHAAEVEAYRLLRKVPVDLNWVDCTSALASAACVSDLAPTDLVIRILPKALPLATADALGIAGSQGGEAKAFLFYDRMVALRTHARPLPSIVGRVLAHEIVHVLLPDQSHSDFGLMRGQWSTDDLLMASSACLALPAASVRLMEKEALRRVLNGRSLITPQ
jgi:hypothetical protein